MFKEHNLYRFVQIKVPWKTFHPFFPLHFLPEFVPHTEFKGRPEDAKWNVLNHTSFRNYAPFSLQVPSILSILLASTNGFYSPPPPPLSKSGLKLVFKGTVQWELRWVKIGINRTARINCIVGKGPLPCPHGHHHERKINVLSGFITFWRHPNQSGRLLALKNHNILRWWENKFRNEETIYSLCRR